MDNTLVLGFSSGVGTLQATLIAPHNFYRKAHPRMLGCRTEENLADVE